MVKTKRSQKKSVLKRSDCLLIGSYLSDLLKIQKVINPHNDTGIDEMKRLARLISESAGWKPPVSKPAYDGSLSEMIDVVLNGGYSKEITDGVNGKLNRMSKSQFCAFLLNAGEKTDDIVGLLSSLRDNSEMDIYSDMEDFQAASYNLIDILNEQPDYERKEIMENCFQIIETHVDEGLEESGK